jgi:hypothetical protein
MLDTFTSPALSVCDHQIAHVYLNDPSQVGPVRDLFGGLADVARILTGDERAEIGLDHARAGDLVLLAAPDAWFAYPYWLDDRLAPDYARTVNIHAKPGYDPCELFFDPKMAWPKGRAAWRLMQKKLGLRTLFDVVPLDAGLVKGSHGLPVTATEDCPILIGGGAPPGQAEILMTGVRDLVLEALELPP